MAATLRRVGEKTLGMAPRLAHVRPFALNLTPFNGKSEVPSDGQACGHTPGTLRPKAILVVQLRPAKDWRHGVSGHPGQPPRGTDRKVHRSGHVINPFGPLNCRRGC
eukprot:scaffold1106_cov608-Prasinococcus_capsulatus_cf.AAC.3